MASFLRSLVALILAAFILTAFSAPAAAQSDDEFADLLASLTETYAPNQRGFMLQYPPGFEVEVRNRQRYIVGERSEIDAFVAGERPERGVGSFFVLAPQSYNELEDPSPAGFIQSSWIPALPGNDWELSETTLRSVNGRELATISGSSESNNFDVFMIFLEVDTELGPSLVYFEIDAAYGQLDPDLPPLYMAIASTILKEQTEYNLSVENPVTFETALGGYQLEHQDYWEASESVGFVALEADFEIAVQIVVFGEDMANTPGDVVIQSIGLATGVDTLTTFRLNGRQGAMVNDSGPVGGHIIAVGVRLPDGRLGYVFATAPVYGALDPILNDILAIAGSIRPLGGENAVEGSNAASSQPTPVPTRAASTGACGYTITLTIDELHIVDAKEADTTSIIGGDEVIVLFGIATAMFNEDALDWGPNDRHFQRFTADGYGGDRFSPGSVTRQVTCGEADEFGAVIQVNEDDTGFFGSDFDILGETIFVFFDLTADSIPADFDPNLSTRLVGETSDGTYDYRLEYTVAVEPR